MTTATVSCVQRGLAVTATVSMHSDGAAWSVLGRHAHGVGLYAHQLPKLLLDGL